MSYALTKKNSSKKTTHRNHAKSSWRSGTWIGLLVFISVWMFIFGILVGRGTISTPFKFDESQKELYTMAEKAAEKVEKQDPIGEMSGEIAPDPFGELKKSSGSEIKKNDLIFSNTDKPKTATQVSPRQPKKQEKEKISKKPPPPSQSVPPKSASLPTKPVVKPKPKTTMKTHRTLQAASMQSLSEAKRMVARLQKKGYKAYVASSATAGKGVHHRVRIGPYKNEKDATSALERLKKDGIQGIMLNLN